MTDDPLTQAPPPVPRDLEARPERLLIVARRREDSRYLFVRWPDWPHPAMLSTVPPHPDEGLAGGLASLLDARMGVRVQGEPRSATERQPARMRHPYAGSEGLGWLRPVAVEVTGTPAPDPLLDDILALTHAEALDTLPADLERVLFRAGAALLEPPPAPDPGTDVGTVDL
jgi:hypothetical protein